MEELSGKYRYNQVVLQIEEMISSGEIRPGDRLPPERSLARDFGVSRNCVRQAIQEMTARELLESRRGAGTYVRQSGSGGQARAIAAAIHSHRSVLREIVEFRLLIEPPIAALAAVRITGDALDRLKILVCDQERRLLAGQDDSDLDSEFHRTLAMASANSLVLELVENMNEALEKSRSRSVRGRLRSRISVTGHLRVVNAMEKRDPELARQVMTEHLREIERMVLAETPVDPEDITADRTK